jgi:hypothetical protein
MFAKLSRAPEFVLALLYLCALEAYFGTASAMERILGGAAALRRPRPAARSEM